MKVTLVILMLTVSQVGDLPGDYYVKDFYENTCQLSKEGWLLKKKKTAYWYYYFESGKIREEGSYLQDMKHGYWQSNYQNGNPKSKGHYDNGLKTGWWKFYHSKGKLSMESTFKGIRMNEWSKVFDGQGNLHTVGKFTNDKKDYYWKTYLNGKMIIKEEWSNGRSVWKTQLNYTTNASGIFDVYKEGNLRTSGTFTIKGDQITFYTKDSDQIYSEKLD